MAEKPHILFVPGYWEGRSAFDAVIAILRSNGFDTTVAPIQSTGKTNPRNESSAPRYTMASDILAIREVVEPLVAERGCDVMMVLHSAGGFLGSNAIEGLTRKARGEKGLPGGVAKIVFVAAGISAEGGEHSTTREKGLPFFDWEGDRMVCRSPRELLYNDILDSEEAQRHVQGLSCQPAFGWDGATTYAGWREVPSAYIVCEQDLVLVKDVQMKCAALAGSKVLSVDVGHMPNITQPSVLARIVMHEASV